MPHNEHLRPDRQARVPHRRRGARAPARVEAQPRQEQGQRQPALSLSPLQVVARRTVEGQDVTLFAGQPIEFGPLQLQLRDYQQAAISAVHRWFADNQVGNPLVVVPTGGGKSVIIAAFAHGVLSAWRDQRLLIVTHVRELIEQNHATLLRAWPSAPAGIYSAGLNRRE